MSNTAYFNPPQTMYSYSVQHFGSSLSFYSNCKEWKGRVPLVLIHGFCESAKVWTEWIAQLSIATPIISIDLPGFGRSDLGRVAAVADYAAAVRAILDECGIARCMVVGHSLGGYVALQLLHDVPSLFVGVGLFHSHPFIDAPDRIQARERGISLLRAGRRDLYVAQLFPNLFRDSFQRSHPDILARMIKEGQQSSPDAIIAALQAMITRKDHVSTLEQTKCPILYLLGKEDALVPVEDVLKVAALTSIADIQLLPDVSHMGMFEAPEATASAVEAFYRRCVVRG